MKRKILRRFGNLGLLLFSTFGLYGLGNPTGSGLLLAPSAQVLGPGKVVVGFSVEGVRGQDLYRVPTTLELRMGIVPGLEGGIFGGAVVQEGLDLQTQGTLGFALKVLVAKGLVTGGLRAFTLSLGGLYRQNLDIEAQTENQGFHLYHEDGNFPGLSAGLILESRRGPFGLYLASDFRTSPVLPPDAEILNNPRTWASWLYFRGGTEVVFGPFFGGISGALRTKTLGSSGDLENMEGTLAYELRFAVPHTPLTLGVYGRTLFPENSSSYLPYTYGGLLVEGSFALFSQLSVAGE
ncbi:MAG: hypothetical protein GW949_00405 [Spirochaetales bacterium]|nr:hypothetical protein [Spirochaetales bacterium]